MNILCISDFRAECSGNFINSLLALADKGKKLNYNIIFMFPLRDDGTECNWVKYIQSYGYTVILYDGNITNDQIKQRLLQILEEFEIELIHSHFSALYNILLWDKEIHSKVKIIFHDHMDYVAENPVMPQLRKQIKHAKRYKEYGIGVISVMKKKYYGYFLVPKKWYVPNGITYKRNVDRSLTREECRNELGISDDEKLCLFLGWDIYRKGLDVAINSVKLLRKNGLKITLGVVGFGSNPDIKEINRIKDIIGFDPRQDGVRFLDSQEDMYALHRAADVYLSASRTEAFSYGILEAISQNVPVVVSNIVGTKWSWRYTKCFKYPKENINKCAMAIKKALECRDNLSNRKQITDKFNIDIWCDRVINTYKEMIN